MFRAVCQAIRAITIMLLAGCANVMTSGGTTSLITSGERVLVLKSNTAVPVEVVYPIRSKSGGIAKDYLAPGGEQPIVFRGVYSFTMKSCVSIEITATSKAQFEGEEPPQAAKRTWWVCPNSTVQNEVWTIESSGNSLFFR